jgi:hypothetical protein
MGFNKRILTKELILNTPSKFITLLLSADDLIMDKWSTKFVEEFQSGLDKESIIQKLDVNRES